MGWRVQSQATLDRLGTSLLVDLEALLAGLVTAANAECGVIFAVRDDGSPAFTVNHIVGGSCPLSDYWPPRSEDVRLAPIGETRNVLLTNVDEGCAFGAAGQRHHPADLHTLRSAISAPVISHGRTVGSVSLASWRGEITATP